MVITCVKTKKARDAHKTLSFLNIYFVFVSLVLNLLLPFKRLSI